jgi:RND family efflux transporter MFP subunit
VKHNSERLLSFLVIGLLAAFLIGFLPRYYKQTEVDEEAEENHVVRVIALKVRPDLKNNDLTLPSTTEGFHETPIWARVDGYLRDYNVDIGDRVSAGQLLSTIDTPELDARRDQAKSDLARFIADLEIAEISALRWQSLYNDDPGATTAQKVDEETYAFQSAKAAAFSARANLARIESMQEFKHITAPFDGIIVERNVDIGSLISGGVNNPPQQLFKIAKIDTIRVFVNVPQYYFRSIQVGDSAEVKVAEFPNRTFKGVVARTANALDPIARTMRTEVDIDNKEKELFPGLYAEVTFSLKSKLNRFILPAEALIIRTGPPQMAVVNQNGIVKIKDVTIGLDNGSTVEIVDGLQDNDLVIINPNEKIKTGIKVETTPPAS